MLVAAIYASYVDDTMLLHTSVVLLWFCVYSCKPICLVYTACDNSKVSRLSIYIGYSTTTSGISDLYYECAARVV